MSVIQELLYQNWLRRLAALKTEADKRDWSSEGQSRYDVAYAQAKQAYWLLCDEDSDLKLYDAGNQKVYGDQNATV